jgi:hypothetical protein
MRGGLVAGVVLTVALAGCGGASEESKVRDTANAFLKAARSRDGEKMCSYLSPDARDAYGQLGDIRCAQGALEIQLPAAGKIKRVEIHGAAATVRFDDPQGSFVDLVKSGERWRVQSAK